LGAVLAGVFGSGADGAAVAVFHDTHGWQGGCHLQCGVHWHMGQGCKRDLGVRDRDVFRDVGCLGYLL